MNQDDTKSPFSTKPQEAPKKVGPVGGMMGFFDGETESETPLGSNSQDSFYEVLKNAPFNLSDPSRPPETVAQTAETKISFMGSIDFAESNRGAEETKRLNELKVEIEQSDSGIAAEEKHIETEEATNAVWEKQTPQRPENEGFGLGEMTRLKDYIKFGEFFSIIGGEGKFGFKTIKRLIVENILPPKKNPKAEALQNMSPEKQREEQKKQRIKRAQATFYSRLRDITRSVGADTARVLRGRREGVNKQVGISESFSGSVNEISGEVRMDLQVLAERKNSEMKAAEIKAKKQQQIAAVTRGGKNLRTHLGAQEGQSMVANAVLTAG